MNYINGKSYYLIRVEHNGNYLEIIDEIPESDRQLTASIVFDMRRKLREHVLSIPMN